ncbi:hypothetical protein MRX96_008182 [Rhipicephalus microplus]
MPCRVLDVRYCTDSLHRRTDIFSDKRHQQAVVPSQRYESISLPVRQRRFTVIPLPNEGIGSPTTSLMAAYMKSWWNSGAFSGRVNSTKMQLTNPFCFVVQLIGFFHGFFCDCAASSSLAPFFRHVEPAERVPPDCPVTRLGDGHGVFYGF